MLSLLSQAWKSWKTAKAVALLAILALAIGIGSATAIYTVVHSVLVKPLPYLESNRLVGVYGAILSEPGKKNGRTDAYLTEFSRRQHSFDVFGEFTLPAGFNLTAPGEPQHVNGVRVTPTLAKNLAPNLKLGRWFGEAWQENGNSNLAVLSYELWQRLGRPQDILNRSVVLDGQSYQVTGVAPAWFQLPLYDIAAQARNDIWIPISPEYVKAVQREGLFLAYARLRPGLPLVRAEEDARRVASEMAREQPGELAGTSVLVEPLQASITEQIRPTLLLLLAAAGLLLLLTCANVSGLLVTRAVSRGRETAIRLALGAAQTQLLLQYFSEALIVSVIGAVGGMFLSYGLLRVVLSLAADYIPQANEIGINWIAVAFAVLTAVIASLLTSLAPVWQALRTTPNEALTSGVRASGGLRSRRLSEGLVIAEVALAFTLLAVSAILAAQLRTLNRVQPGFDPEHLLTFQLTPSGLTNADDAKIIAYQKQLTDALKSVPGVTDAALISHLPLAGCCYTAKIYPEGRVLPSNTALSTSFQVASSDYFRTMRIPVIAGRTLTDHDTGEKPVLVVLNQTAARHFWGKPDPVGAYGRFGGIEGDRFQIVGVVGDVRNDGLDHSPLPEIYLSSRVDPMLWLSVVVRSELAERALVPAIRQAIHRLNPSQPIFGIRSMHDIAQDSLTLQRATSLLTTFFAAAALLLAGLGVYGVVSYSVRQRTVEIGTRMAIGAVSRDLLRMVIGGGFKMALGGILLGGLAAFVAALLLQKASVVHTIEPSAFLYSLTAIAAITLVASSYPAWRAMQLSPIVAIRNEPETAWLRRVKIKLAGLRTSEKDEPEASETSSLTGFIEATRGAATFENALQLALSTLTEKLGAQSSFLVEKYSETRLRTVVAVPASNVDASALELPVDGFLARRLQFYSLPLPLTEGDFEALSRWAAEQKGEHSAEIAALKQAKVRLAVALRTTKETLGLLLLGPPARRKEYSAAAKRRLQVSADQFALMLENARLTDRVVEQEKLRRDVALAVEVQKRLLPDSFPVTEIGQVSAFTLPARNVGGDYYDFFRVGDHNVGIALADVAGKGVAAALIMSVVQASLRILSAENKISLPELVGRMNRFLHRSTGANSYATFFYAQIDERTNQLSYVNAGHNPPYLLRSGTTAPEELAEGGMVIGLFAQAGYQEAKVDLRAGDVLIAFTDGVTEALNLSEEEFGEERLKDLLRQVAHLPVDQMSSCITEELRKWIGAAIQHDDLTFLVLKVN